MSTKVYVVGTLQGAKVNQYESMTNSLEEAQRLAGALGPDSVVKEVPVQAPRRRKQ